MADRITYVRFVVGDPAGNPHWMTGVITAARLLRDDGRLEPHEAVRVEQIFAWFNENLPCPPFKANLKSGKWSDDAVAWFKDSAREPISQMWEIVAILKEHGVSVRFFRSEAPGEIVYSDDYQVVAETPPQA